MTTHEGAARAIDDVLDTVLAPSGADTAPGAVMPSGIETRSTRPPVAAEPGADPIAALAASIDRQTAAFEQRTAAPAAPAAPARPAAPAPQTLRARIEAARQSRTEARARRLAELRSVADREDRDTRRGRPDPLYREQRQRINDAIDRDDRNEIAALRREVRELRRAQVRPHGPTERRSTLPGLPGQQPGSGIIAYRAAVQQYMRTGIETFNGVHLQQLAARARLDLRAANTQDNVGGGYLVVPERDTGPLEALLKQISPMRSLATVRTMGSAEFQKPVNKRGLNGRWVGEGAASTADNTPDFDLLRFFAFSMLAEPEVTPEMLEDSGMDFETFLAEESQDSFAEMEGTAYISGSGVGRPKGFLAYDAVANASWVYGKIGYLATGASGDWHATLPGDVLRKLPLELKAGYRQEGRWLMNRRTMGSVRTIKDLEGRYIWSDGDVSKGIPNTLDGYPVSEDEQMPDIAAGSYAVAFGNWRRGYLILDRLGFSVIRNPYINAPMVRFHMRKRVAGGVQNFEAIKTIKFASS